jgi:hypothetical protein
MNILKAEILKEVSGGLHLEHHHENTEDKIKNKAEEMKERVTDAYDDLGLPKIHVED